MLEMFSLSDSRTWLRDVSCITPYSASAGDSSKAYAGHTDQSKTRIPTHDTYQAPQRCRKLTFLDLPLEIRLEIYSHVHLAHPMQQAELCPWYPTPKHSAYFLAPIMTPIFWREGNDDTPHSTTSLTDGRRPFQKPPRLLSPHRPQSYLPSALFRVSRQVYAEARCLPFHDNEFVFVTWFSSGLSAARAFVRGLRPWQRGAMRHARIEMQIRDLGDGARLAVWEELCGYWSEGLRGLRLKVELEDLGVKFGKAQEPEQEGAWWPLEKAFAPRTWTGEPYRWVEGLKALKELSAVEIELVGGKGMPERDGVEWCAAVERMLNAGRDGQVRVVCVGKVGGTKTGNRGPMGQDM